MDFLLHFLVDGIRQSQLVNKIIHGRDDEYELDIFVLRLTLHGNTYVSSRLYDCMEIALIDLQKQLPKNTQIICCQSCKHGNFCPFGDQDNEIFCLKEHRPSNKRDVVNLFQDYDADYFNNKKSLPHNELSHICENYVMISDDYYTYNGWNYDINDIVTE